MIEDVVSRAPVFLLVAVRVFALLMTVPLLSAQNVSRIVKIALTGYIAYLVLPRAYSAGWDKFSFVTGAFSVEYIMFMLGEAALGIITGLYVSIIFAAFSSAGQFFTYQMGFGASEVYDALSQIENPLMGQYLNLIAMLVFLQTSGFQKLFLGGLFRSFQSLNSMVLVAQREQFLRFIMTGLTDLFFDALMISLPIIGTLILTTLTMGLLTKAAPQMNLLSESFPLTIIVSFFLLMVLIPIMCQFFSRSFDVAFTKLEDLFAKVAPAQL